jgi:hypothetical protein
LLAGEIEGPVAIDELVAIIDIQSLQSADQTVVAANAVRSYEQEKIVLLAVRKPVDDFLAIVHRGNAKPPEVFAIGMK